jgi:DNA topoisomerase
MEKEKIGTKATRSEVISILFKRNYITSTTTRSNGRGEIGATEVGFRIIQSMRKYVPSIISTDFTRSMEEQLDEIESGKARSTLVIENAIDKLTGTLITLKEKEIGIGRQITEAVIISQNQQQMVLGTCPACSKGNHKIKGNKKEIRRMFQLFFRYMQSNRYHRKDQYKLRRSVLHADGQYSGLSMLQNIRGSSVSICNVHQKSNSLNQHEGLDIITTSRYIWN